MVSFLIMSSMTPLISMSCTQPRTSSSTISSDTLKTMQYCRLKTGWFKEISTYSKRYSFIEMDDIILCFIFLMMAIGTSLTSRAQRPLYGFLQHA